MVGRQHVIACRDPMTVLDPVKIRYLIEKHGPRIVVLITPSHVNLKFTA